MDAKQVGEKLVELCKAGKNEEAITSLYDKDIVSLEAQAAPGQPAETRGRDACLGKSKWWRENNTVHGATVRGPYPLADRFAVAFSYDITPKQTGKRMTMDEVALYWVKNGKIVREEFMYSM